MILIWHFIYSSFMKIKKVFSLDNPCSLIIIHQMRNVKDGFFHIYTFSSLVLNSYKNTM